MTDKGCAMNSKQTLAVFGTAALCGLALAQTPKVLPPADRLDALEKEVAALRAKVDAVKPSGSDQEVALKKELADTRVLVNQLITWAAAQANGAAELERVFDDSEQKGFTFGINPDSRIALLAGWRSFTAGLQKDAPKPIEGADAKTKKTGKDVKPSDRPAR
jgi:hypothetical protein